MGNSLGKLFTVTGFGESHGPCVGVVIDGCPAGLKIAEAEIQTALDKRKPIAGTLATARVEEDKAEILSGIFNGYTTGAPICLLVRNKDTDSGVYEKMRFLPRPGHADFTAFMKYGGFNDYRGGGRFSGRITAGYVMAGAVARKLLDTLHIDIVAHIIEIGGVAAGPVSLFQLKKNVLQNPLRCADVKAAEIMLQKIKEAGAAGDSVGGVVEGVALNLPVGLGEPVCDTLEGDLAKALFAIPAVKGVEFGAGFPATAKKGSENNDAFVMKSGKIQTLTNNAGGISGGISNGMPIIVRVAVKPTPSIAIEQQTVDLKTKRAAKLEIKGRHDTCIVPRVVPVVEAMIAITLCDFALRTGKIPGVIE